MTPSMLQLILLPFFVLTLFSSCKKKDTTSEPIDPTIEYLSKFTGTTKIKISKTFKTGFEDAADVAGFYVVPSPQIVNSTAVNTFHELTTELAHTGSKSHKGWFTDVNPTVTGQNTNHRGYPTIQLHKTPNGTFNNLVFVEFWVYLDIELVDAANKDWFSFATLCAYSDDQWQRTLLINLHKKGYMHLAHVPTQGEHLPNIYQDTLTQFPKKEWVKISAIIDYTNQNQYGQPYSKVWQNGKLMSASKFNPRLDCGDINPAYNPAGCVSSYCTSEDQVPTFENNCGLTYTGGLSQAHFGMYAPPLLSSGTVYNDDLVIYELEKTP